MSDAADIPTTPMSPGPDAEATPLPTCDVCRGSYTVEEAFSTLDLCHDHAMENAGIVAERVLRGVIPAGLHHAHPSDLPVDFAGWDGLGSVGLFLHGPVGTGKSHAAAALVKRAFMRRYVAGPDFPKTVWMNVPTAILQTLSAFSKKQDPSKLWDDATNATLLVLDDIGIEQPKEWVRTRMYGLIEYRLHAGVPTIITSNLDLDGLADRMDLPQVSSRISSMCVQVSYAGRKDRRVENAPTLL